MIRKSILLVLLMSLFLGVNAQKGNNIYEHIQKKLAEGTNFQKVNPFEPLNDFKINTRENINYETFRPEANAFRKIVTDQPDAIAFSIQFKGRTMDLLLVSQNILAPGFNVKTSSGNPFQYKVPQFYRGIVKGSPESVVAITFYDDDVIGVLDTEDDQNLVLGALNEDGPRKFVLYDINTVSQKPDFDCDALFIDGISDQLFEDNGTNYRVDNCVNVYFECEHNFFLERGSVQSTVDQMTGIFNVVSTLYANETVTTNISEIKVWDTPDNYVTTGTADALYDFRNKVPNYNGDLAHLVSRGSPTGGGVAFINGLCNSYGYAYSYINSSYNQFPSYSWTVNVIAHEMGHNLGSRHTHDCVWNGNNTALDGCGPTAGYSSGSCPTAPLPSNGGTVMSYCHLIGSVGINFNNGFGLQPGNVIRSVITNASCLSSCATCNDEGLACDDGDPCTTNDVLDANCNCSGTPEPDTDGDGVCDLEDLCPGFNDNLIGTTCNDGDACTVNDVYTVDCNCIGTFADDDGDGVCNADDICPGFDDNIDADGDGVPDGCDLNCSAATGFFSTNPLSHSGNGSSTATLTFGNISQNITFTITGVDAQLSGNPNSRYNETVTVSYVNENDQNQNFGTFSGNQSSSFNILIPARAKSVTVSLFDGYDGSANGLSINLSAVDFCEDDIACPSPDSDGDGVCDDLDICPGFDDKADADGDGIPDGCDNCSDLTGNFTPSNLNHSGTGSSNASLDFGTTAANVSFTVSGLDARLNGKTDRRYIEFVTISYDDGSGNNIVYGNFSGELTSFVNVNIPAARSVNISLSDSYDGNTEAATLSVSISQAQACAGGASAPLLGQSVALSNNAVFELFPNPAQDFLSVNYQNNTSQSGSVDLRLIDLNGRVVFKSTYDFSSKGMTEKISLRDQVPSIYILQVQDGETIFNKKVIILDR